MTILDLFVIVILVVYAVLGFFSGVIRRVIGFLSLFLAFGAATYLAPDGGRFLQQGVRTSLEPADARIYAYFGFLLLVVILIEALAAAYNPLLQASVVVLDRATGLVLGLLTGAAVSVLVIWLLNGAGNPSNANPTLLQSDIRQAVTGSALHDLALGRAATGLTKLFEPVLPSEPEHYFSVSKQS